MLPYVATLCCDLSQQFVLETNISIGPIFFLGVDGVYPKAFPRQFVSPSKCLSHAFCPENRAPKWPQIPALSKNDPSQRETAFDAIPAFFCQTLFFLPHARLFFFFYLFNQVCQLTKIDSSKFSGNIVAHHPTHFSKISLHNMIYNISHLAILPFHFSPGVEWLFMAANL